jgi:hypothetical protein
MIPPAQFDPATLAIWTTTSMVAAEESEMAVMTMRMAASGDDLAAVFGNVPDENPVRTRLIWLASSVWHEKRHYFDTCLTNYGARRFRNLFNLAANVGPLLVDAKERGDPVWFPVEVYAYPPGVRKLLGIPDPPPNILQSATLARSMKSFTSQLDAAPGSGDVLIELGGGSQMEGLAQVSQSHSVEYFFGLGDLQAISQTYIHKLPRTGPYRAIEAVAGMLGCSKEVGEIIAVNSALAAALFVTALCGRYFGAGPQPDEDLVAPWPRLARMIEALGPQPGRFDMNDDEAVEMVDKIARQLWGRTAFEEISSDIDLMEESVKLSDAPWIGEGGLYDAYVDFIALRRRLLAEAQKLGPASLLPRAFPEKWLNRLQPWHVVATPDGGGVADDSVIVFGVSLNLPAHLKGILASEATWGRLYAQPDDVAGEFAPHNREAWLQMLETQGPFALLMLNGRRHRRMIAPELERPLKDIEGLGISVRFHPRFEWPEDRDQETRSQEAIALAEFSGRKTFICDVTLDQIEPAIAAVLTPWEFRNSKLLPRVREGGIINEILLVTNWADWLVRRDLLD